MKLAISADGPGLEANVSNKMGMSKYVLIIDLESIKIEAVPNPIGPGPGGSSMQVVVLAISKKVDAVLTGYCSPIAKKYLLSNGIEVITGVIGTVGQVVKDCENGLYQNHKTRDEESYRQSLRIYRISMVHALQRSKNQIVNILPILTGVVLLIGLFNAFASKDMLMSIFSRNSFKDLLLGASCGSIFAGNPVNSYVIGGELLNNGVSLYAVTAFIISWVTVGAIQLPAEMAALGKGFALMRNGLSFILSMVIAMFTVIILKSMVG
ncbi:MAG: permease [Deltaproteobacteria bacterium]|nr:permease [Deltaproteobacteria bacterium]MBW2151295.1 permease [Deltaproteobacteria bacterium]